MSNRPFPTVYYKFSAPDVDKSSQIEYRIEDFPPDRIEDGVKFMMEHFVDDEPVFRSRNVKLDPVAVEEGAQMWREGLEQHASIVCFKKDSNEILAMNILTIENEDEDDADDVDSEKVKRGSRRLSWVNFVIFSFNRETYGTF